MDGENVHSWIRKRNTVIYKFNTIPIKDWARYCAYRNKLILKFIKEGQKN